jgi:hypothetical protein
MDSAYSAKHGGKSFMQKMKALKRRTAQKIYQKVGKAEASNDEEFDALFQKFATVDNALTRVHDDLRRMNDSMRRFGNTMSESSEHFLQIFDRTSKLRHVALMYRDVCEFVDRDLRPPLDAKMLENVMEPITQQMAKFVHLHELVEKRRRLLLDYDAYRRQVKAMVEKPDQKTKDLPKKEEKLNLAASKYTALNERLIEEFTIIDQHKSVFLMRPLTTLMSIQTDFFGRVYGEYSKATPVLSDSSLGETMNECFQEWTNALETMNSRDADQLQEIAKVRLHADDPTGLNPVASSTVSIGRNSAGPPTGSSLPPPPAKMPEPPKPKGFQVRATFDYTAQADGELSMKEGDEITVIKEDDSGWWQGVNGGKEGWFPSNYVERV